MRRFIKPTVLTLCLMTLAIGATTGLDTDYAQVAEDVEVMARIIDKTLEGEFPNEYKAYRTGSLLGGNRDGCQGIYLEGYGAVFMTRVDFPVAEQKAPQKETTPDDLWQRTRYELRGAQGGLYADIFASRGAGESYDSGKVERLKEELLGLIGMYAPNIRQLGLQENVVIAVRGMPAFIQISINSVDQKAKQFMEQETERLKKELEKLQQQQNKAKEEAQSLLNKAGPGETVPTLPSSSRTTGISRVIATSTNAPTAAPDVTTSVIVKTSEEAPRTIDVSGVRVAPGAANEPGGISYGAAISGKGNISIYGVTSGKGNRGRTTLIIKASKKDTMAYKDGKIDLDGFMEKAEIIQY